MGLPRIALHQPDHNALDYVIKAVASLICVFPGPSTFGKVLMDSPSPLTKDPAEYMWELAVKIAAKQGFHFSPECEANLKERLKSGIEVYKIGLYEFRERIKEAEDSIEELVQLTIIEEIVINPASKVLHEPSMFSALYARKLCPGLWPLC
jgi:hypothetical protein